MRRFRRANVAQENERAQEQQDTRQLVTWFDNDGMLVVQGRLAPDQGALLMKALEVATDELRHSERGSAESSPAVDPVAQSDGDQLRADCLCPGLRAERALADGAAEASSADRFQVVVHVDAEVLADPEADGRGSDAHHVRSWAEGGPTVLSNILPLCRSHHTLVHEGGYRVEALPGGGFRFLRPDGREVLPAPPLPAVIGDPAEALAARWIPPDVTLTPSTGLPTWQGDPVDYDWAVETLVMYAEGGVGRRRLHTLP